MRGWLASVALLAGCAELDIGVDAGPADWRAMGGADAAMGGSMLNDMGDVPEVSPMGDAGSDAAAPQDEFGEPDGAVEPEVDSGSTPESDASASGVDAGVPPATGPVTVDGVLTGDEWDGAQIIENEVATDWGPGLNQLQSLRARVHDGNLALALEGRVENVNAIVLYVDAVPTKGIPSPSFLTDASGALDATLDNTLAVPADFEADAAWGTRAMPAPAEAEAGWRNLDDPSDLAWMAPATAPTGCSASACETLVPLSSLGATPGGTLRLFVRITNAGGDDFANQTLPQDNPNDPSTVSQLWTVQL